MPCRLIEIEADEMSERGCKGYSDELLKELIDVRLREMLGHKSPAELVSNCAVAFDDLHSISQLLYELERRYDVNADDEHKSEIRYETLEVY